jgi:hypothetical protein
MYSVTVATNIQSGGIVDRLEGQLDCAYRCRGIPTKARACYDLWDVDVM